MACSSTPRIWRSVAFTDSVVLESLALANPGCTGTNTAREARGPNARLARSISSSRAITMSKSVPRAVSISAVPSINVTRWPVFPNRDDTLASLKKTSISPLDPLNIKTLAGCTARPIGRVRPNPIRNRLSPQGYAGVPAKRNKQGINTTSDFAGLATHFSRTLQQVDEGNPSAFKITRRNSGRNTIRRTSIRRFR